MFEFEQFDSSEMDSVANPALVAEEQRRFGSSRIRSFSLLSWGEHCSECAFPSCFTSCSFYQPRQDGRCRRFRFGVYKSDTPRSWMDYSAYIEFKAWSKLWTQGNATQLPAAASRGLQMLGTAAWALSGPLDGVLRSVSGRKRLSLGLQSLRRRLIRKLGRLYNQFPKPDCLLIEVFNPAPAEAKLHVSIRGEGVPGRVDWRGIATPGFSSSQIPVEAVEKIIDLAKPFQLNLSIDQEEGKKLYFCSATFVRLAAQSTEASAPAKAAPATKVKCVVWDLDHTLWDGVLLEGESNRGFDLKDGILSVLRELDRRGILLSIASKNSEEDARKELERLGIWELFLVPQVGWQPKSVSVQQIATKLNIGRDSIAFIDDQPFERDEVASVLPMVRVIDAQEALSILGRPEFSGDASNGGGSRRLMYQTEFKREEDMAAAGGDFDAFLANCEIKTAIQRPTEELLPRLYDIVQRTNQLNIASERYEMEQLRALIHDTEHPSYIISCQDRYGEYGYVGFIVLAKTPTGILLRDCMFSCRVQGKRIDEAVLAHLINHYLRSGARSVQARFNPTKRNAPAAEMLARVGFATKPGVQGTLAIEPASVRTEVPFVAIESEMSVGASR